MSRLIASLVVALAACGRVNFDPLDLGDDVIGGDAPNDAPAALCMTWGTWGGPVEIQEFRGLPTELDPSFGRIDELWITENSGGFDLYTWQRDGSGAYGMRTPFAFNTGSRESEPAITADQLDLLFLSDRGGQVRLYETTRTAVGQPFSTPVIALGFENVVIQSHDVTPDGLTVYFENGGAQAVATRSSRTTAFGAPTPLGITGQWASISADERELYYQNGGRAYMRSRGSVGDTFGAEVEIAPVSPVFNGDLEVTPDGSELWMADYNNGLYLLQRSCLD